MMLSNLIRLKKAADSHKEILRPWIAERGVVKTGGMEYGVTGDYQPRVTLRKARITPPKEQGI